MKIVIIHGGGPQINSLLARLNIKSSFVNGLRVTDDATLEAVELALCGQVNKAIVRLLLNNDIPACGISGQDGGLLIARQKNPRLGHVGEIIGVNPAILDCLLNGGFMPVVAPLALDGESRPLNVNADIAAGSIAGALGADYFILISDVAGVMDENKNVIPSLNTIEIEQLISAGVISGGMIPKTECCISALQSGCNNALVLDGRQQSSLLRYIENNEPLGTLIRI